MVYGGGVFAKKRGETGSSGTRERGIWKEGSKSPRCVGTPLRVENFFLTLSGEKANSNYKTASGESRSTILFGRETDGDGV